MTPTARGNVERVVLAIALVVLLVPATPAVAQLDPLLFVKGLPPNVIVVLDTSLSMLEDGEGRFYDPNTYLVADDPIVAREMGADLSAARRYRRIYDGLRMVRPVTPFRKYTTETITAVDETVGSFGSFWSQTRLEVAKSGISKAVHDNRGIGDRWAFVGLRQRNPRWRLHPDCDKPVTVTADDRLTRVGDATPCDAGGPGRYGVYAPVVDAPNYRQRSANGVRLPYGSLAADVIDLVARPINDPRGLIPAGQDSAFFVDRPIAFALEDALAQAKTAIAADPGNIECRNTVVVLVTGGADSGDFGYRRSNNAVNTAASFLSVPAGGAVRRVPIYVAAIRPESGEDSLAQIASRSGGRYFNVSDATAVSRVINMAVQAGYARSSDFNLGEPSEYQPVSPVVGTVDLTSARSSRGRALSDTVISNQLGQTIPQHSNVMVTAGFELNGTGNVGMEGIVRAFRTFKPHRDIDQPGGYAFVSDGTALWPDVDGRSETSGRARTPSDPDARNIFTYVPGRGTVPFTTDRAPELAPHLGGADADALISFIRNQPLGPVIGSTPAIMSPPSLEPPPDNDYGRRDVAGSYADDYADRRSIIWIGGNNGMIHAIDARTGFEVWAFIPYNLLPKLQTLLDGQSVDSFDYFVDSSPKIAEVKLDGHWRTVLVIGQAYGGTFYQAYDITEAGMRGPAPSSDDHMAVLRSFDDPRHIPLLWSFPRYDEFDPDISKTFALTDGFPGGEVRFFGDLRSTATPAEKSVGFTWSVPAIAPLDDTHGVTAAIVGSGYFPAVETRLPGRGASAPAAGRSLYLIDVKTGTLLGGTSTCGRSGSVGCVDVGDVGGNGRKNAVQADPAAAGGTFSPHVAKAAYVGDIDGVYRRFDFVPTGQITFSTMVDASAPIYAASAVSTDSSGAHMFFGTGSDLLLRSSGGGSLTTKAYGLHDNVAGGGASLAFVRDLRARATERLSSAPTVAGPAVFFTTVVEDPRRPCADVSSRLYAMRYLGSAGGAAYDTNGDGSVGARESPVVATVDGRATAPFVADGHLYFGTSGRSGSKVEMFGDTENFNNGMSQTGVRLLSWRETR